MDTLKKAAEACEEFADKRIAHRDKRDPKVVPTYDQLDNCIKLLDKMALPVCLSLVDVCFKAVYNLNNRYTWFGIW